jgi:hypothetical protein
LYKLELEYSGSLERWDRGKARRTASKMSFRPAYLLPPENLPIQGLLMPKPAEKREKGETEDLRRRNLKRAFRHRRRFRVDRRVKALKMNSEAAENFLCRVCDYMDKMFSRCLVKRLGGECPYINGVYARMIQKEPLIRNF